ncbi:DUF4913 domain-containing protein [Arthrobacter echini]|uniref:DUF4913 domain-containing protein n=1 Tax=Arthrobacter echini TaxID=1529066 RepID=A0A4S5E2N6_9MICC|nr:DUF4913 domain-containing protein [Arthrobacter echini]THJ65637.1 DUF4913 domain-containing protein [Arthrobacter echini]
MTETANSSLGGTEPNGQDDGEDLAYTPEDLVDWVESLVAILESVDRSQNQYWCFQWWNHPEAVDRLRALYEQWLGAQAEGGMSSWWIDHFDRHATILFAKRGPFGECGTTHTEKTARRILGTEQPPMNWSW